MKTEGQIKQKVKQVIFRHRKAYIQQHLAKLPNNCKYNRKVSLPVHMANRATLGRCGYCHEDGTPNDVVCDASMGGERQAQDCAYFEPADTVKSLKREFNCKLGLNGEDPVEIGYIAQEYPDIAALMWVLGPSGKEQNPDPPEEESSSSILAFFGDGEPPEELPERPLVEGSS